MSTRHAITGSWGTSWSHLYSELLRPQPTEEGVKLEFKQKKKGFLGVGSSAGKGIKYPDRSTAESLNAKMCDAYDNFE